LQDTFTVKYTLLNTCRFVRRQMKHSIGRTAYIETDETHYLVTFSRRLRHSTLSFFGVVGCLSRVGDVLHYCPANIIQNQFILQWQTDLNDISCAQGILVLAHCKRVRQQLGQ